MTAEVLHPTKEDLLDWRRAALERVGKTTEQLEEREANSALSTDESNVLTTIRGIDFLLGEDQ